MVYDKYFSVKIDNKTLSFNMCYEWFLDIMGENLDVAEELARVFKCEYLWMFPSATGNVKDIIYSQIKQSVYAYVEYLQKQFKTERKPSWVKRIKILLTSTGSKIP